VHEHFVIKFSDAFDLVKAGPILCAGVTMYNPLKELGAFDDGIHNIGIAGFGGLADIGMKMALKMSNSNKVWILSHTEEKRSYVESQGAIFINMNNTKEVYKASHKLDFVINTICVPHSLDK